MYHIKDSEFLRGKVPMTKEEVRAVSIAKLDMKDTDICLDIGAGTGSVSIEMARFASKGKVYAIEEKQEAVDLIKENMKKFHISNIEIIEGKAPEVLNKVKADKIFIGGSGGNLNEIIRYSYEYLNIDGKIVLNFIVLENIFTALESLKKTGFKNIEITQMMISRNKTIKDFNMMVAENPIYIISAER